MSRIVKNFNKNVKNCEKLSKLSKNCQNCQKKCQNCQNVSQVMFPHHCDQMSQRSQVSRVALCKSKVKVPLVSQWVSDKVTYWAVRWQLKMQEFCTKIKIPLLFPIYWGPGGCQHHLVSFLGPYLFRPGVYQWCLHSFKTFAKYASLVFENLLHFSNIFRCAIASLRSKLRPTDRSNSDC